MTDAYVMLNCELGSEEEIIEQLKQIEQVADVFETIGTHDMLVKLQAENFEKIREIVSWNIQKMKNVRSTATLIKKEK
ncbi:MAG: Lrp/AsnC ligand binding domain-containing protein [Nitrosopumilus sp.]|nr:Lrp/AsnC ligand binding domain-containing protein [Nitrosopumilus sp.]